MVRTVDKHRLQANHWISRQDAVLDTVLKALFDSREEVFRHGAAKYILLEQQPFAVIRRELDPHVAILAMAARLLLVLALHLDRLADRLAVSDARLGQPDVDAEL